MHRQRYVESYIVEGRQYNKTLSLPAQETIPNLFFFLVWRQISLLEPDM